jgi:hypothetical protein
MRIQCKYEPSSEWMMGEIDSPDELIFYGENMAPNVHGENEC